MIRTLVWISAATVLIKFAAPAPATAGRLNDFEDYLDYPRGVVHETIVVRPPPLVRETVVIDRRPVIQKTVIIDRRPIVRKTVIVDQRPVVHRTELVQGTEVIHRTVVAEPYPGFRRGYRTPSFWRH